METIMITNNLMTNASKPLFRFTNELAQTIDECSPYIAMSNSVPVNEVVSVISKTGSAYNVISVHNGNYYILKRASAKENMFVTEIEIKREVGIVSHSNKIYKYYSFVIYAIISIIFTIILISINSIFPIPMEVSVSLVLFLSLALISFIIDRTIYIKKRLNG